MTENMGFVEWLRHLESSADPIDLQGSAYLREIMEVLEAVANNAECPFWRVTKRSCATLNPREHWCSICSATKTWEELNDDSE